MSSVVPSALLSRLGDALAIGTGLRIGLKEREELEQALSSMAPAFGQANAENCAHWLLSAPLSRQRIQVLAKHLTVGETYFFRDEHSIRTLREHVLPALVQARRGGDRHLRIWSAGCCTGEEPYSVAILLDRLLPPREDWRVTLLATDINPLFLRRAARGRYSEWSLRATPPGVRNLYFTAAGKHLQLRKDIRTQVRFDYLNLAEPFYPPPYGENGAMDLILCRNVLMYFASAQALSVVGRLRHALAEDGWLAVSAAETSSSLFAGFSADAAAAVGFYRKTAAVAMTAMADCSQATAPVHRSAAPVAPVRASRMSRRAVPVHAPAGDIVGDPARDHRAARVCASRGKLDEAVVHCEKAMAADKLDPAHPYLLAGIRREQGRTDLVVQLLRRALYLDSDFIMAHFALGSLYLGQGKQHEARRHLTGALRALAQQPPDQPLPEAEGLNAARLAKIIDSLLSDLQNGPFNGRIKGRRE